MFQELPSEPVCQRAELFWRCCRHRKRTVNQTLDRNHPALDHTHPSELIKRRLDRFVSQPIRRNASASAGIAVNELGVVFVSEIFGNLRMRIVEQHESTIWLDQPIQPASRVVPVHPSERLARSS
jgi:hypothetical protein